MNGAKFILKPLMWNTANYKSPSGAKVEGWAKAYGFGVEEWNNSSRMVSANGAERYFHTEAGETIIGSHSDFNGRFVIFMIASHDGRQDLVGVAGNAIFITDKAERAAIANEIKLDEFAEDAWRLDKVKTKFHHTRQEFDKFWQREEIVNWIPCWRCPADHFLWLNPPVKLDAQQITDKKKLISRHSSYQNLDARAADKILRSIPQNQRSPNWDNLLALISPHYRPS